MKKQMAKNAAVSAVVFALSMILLVSASFAQVPSNIFPTDSAPYGRTYAEWMASWQQWATSIPAATHPLFDNGPANTGQSGPVFFLGGKFCATYSPNCGTDNVVRNITIPLGKAVFFPIIDVEVSTVESGSGDPNNPDAVKDINVLRQAAAQFADIYSKISLEIDGFKVPNIQQFRVQSTAFGFYLPPDDIFTAIGEGTFSPGFYFPGVDDGYYVMLKPLTPGKHTIHFHGEGQVWNWVLDVTYNVTVKKETATLPRPIPPALGSRKH